MLDAAMLSSQTSLYFEQIADCTASGVRLGPASTFTRTSCDHECDGPMCVSVCTNITLGEYICLFTSRDHWTM